MPCSECWQIKKKRQQWESEEAREYFHAHARFANGIINLVISHTPPKFLRIMNFLGYKGTESVGLNELNRVAFEMKAGFTSKLAQLLLIYYWVYAKPHGENIPDDLSLCKKLVEAELELFPEVRYRLLLLCFLFSPQSPPIAFTATTCKLSLWKLS